MTYWRSIKRMLIDVASFRMAAFAAKLDNSTVRNSGPKLLQGLFYRAER